jgi:hypothetical protein
MGVSAKPLLIYGMVARAPLRGQSRVPSQSRERRCSLLGLARRKPAAWGLAYRSLAATLPTRARPSRKTPAHSSWNDGAINRGLLSLPLHIAATVVNAICRTIFLRAIGVLYTRPNPSAQDT